MFWKTMVLTIALAGICVAGNHKYSETKKQSWDLPVNAKVEIHVVGADVRVVQGEDATKVTAGILAESDSPNFADEVKTTFQIQGSTGVLTVKQPHGGELTVRVKVPAGTDVMVRATAGDIDVDTPTGSKDIDTSAGDVHVTAGSSTQYSTIDVVTRAGDVSGEACGKVKGWIGHSLHCTGDGKDHIRVHTLAGDIAIREKSDRTELSQE